MTRRRILDALPVVLAGAALLTCASCETVMSVLESAPALDTAASRPEDGLREALEVGTSRAVEALGRDGGYLDSPEVSIPLPDELEKIARALELVGHGREVEEFVTSMNRAAEAAAPRAGGIFVDAIQEVGVTRSYNEIIQKTASLTPFGLPSLDLSDYVTREALDGLFSALAREEERIRTDPVARTTELLRRWFGEQA